MAVQAYRERQPGERRDQTNGSPSPSWHQDATPTMETHAAVDFLSASWEIIQPELRRVLRRLLQPADVDDVMQEVFIRLAARAERRPLVPDAVGDLARLAAWRLGLNAVRDAAVRAQPRAELPEGAVSTDIEEQAVWHMDLDRVLRAVEELPDTDRQAIIRALSPERGRTKREQDRLSLRLFRARGRLRARVAGVLGGLPIWRWRPWPLQLMETAGAVTASMVVATVLAALSATTDAPVQSDIRVTPASEVREAAVEGPKAVVPTAVAPSTPVHPAKAGARQSAATAEAPPAANDNHQQTFVFVPGPRPASIGGEDRGDQEELVCAGGGPLPERMCVPHPLRQ